MEPLASAHQAHADGSGRQAELRRRLIVSEPFEIAKYHRRAISFRQAVDFIVQHLGLLLAVNFVRGICRRIVPSPAIRALDQSPLPQPVNLELARRPQRHPMKPGAQPRRLRQRAGPPRQHEERCLECVLGVVHVVQNAVTHRKHHWPVPFHEHLERMLGDRAALGNELADKLFVREPCRRPFMKQDIDERGRRIGVSRHHDALSSSSRISP